MLLGFCRYYCASLFFVQLALWFDTYQFHLQVLIDKGVTTDEIKLYGETDSGNIIDESLPEDSFSELEAVISKVSTNFLSCLSISFSVLSF